MEIEQHFYASVPAEVGLTGRRGLQTCAKSARTGDDSMLEAHCRYSRPDGRRDGAMPVNWGWFPLEDGRVCVHRIGYSGTDELGRPGNFMAHNLIVSEDDLLAIDYDVTSLLRWVRDRSDQFSMKNGSSGFARRHDQIYQKYGQDADSLRQIDRLHVESSVIKAIREETDRQFAEQMLACVKGRLGSDGVTRLVEAVLDASGQQKWILVMGMSNGEEESGAEFELAELLFTLLPLHCRKKLTFSTYHEDPREVTKAAAMHNRLRILMSPATENAKAAAKLPQMCVFDVAAGELPAKRAVPAVTRWLTDGAEQGEIARQLEVRDYTNHFQFSEEEQGLTDGQRLLLLRKGQEVHVEDAAVFHRSAVCVRPQLEEFIKTAHHLIRGYLPLREHDACHIEQLTRDYFIVLETFRASLVDEAGETEQQVVQCIGTLFRHCLTHESLLPLESIVPPTFSTIRSAALASMADGIEQTLTEPDQPRFARLWDELRRVCPQDDQDNTLFLSRAATHMCDRVLDHFKAHDGRAEISQEMVPLLRDAPLAKPDQLSMRLELLTHASRNLDPEEAARSCGEFLNQLIADGHLKPELLRTILETRRDVLLRFHDQWLTVAKESDDIRKVLLPVLDEPGLACEFWNVVPAHHDGTLHRGMRAKLSRLESEQDRNVLVDTLLEPYVRSGSGKLGECFRGPPNLTYRETVELVATHCELIAFIYKLLPLVREDAAADAGAAIQYHLVGVMSEACLVRPDETEGTKTVRPLFDPLLKLVFETHVEVDGRTMFFTNVGTRIQERCQGNDHPHVSSLLDHQEVAAALKSHGLSPEESFWYLCCLKTAMLERDTMPNRVGQLCELLLRYPTQVDAEVSASPFTAFIQSQLTQDVWIGVAHELHRRVHSAQDPVHALLGFFAPNSAYHGLVGKLKGQRVRTQDEQDAFLLGELGHWLVRDMHCGDPIRMLTSLLRYTDLPEEIRNPAKQQLAIAVNQQLEHFVRVAERTKGCDATFERFNGEDAHRALTEVFPALECVANHMESRRLVHFWKLLAHWLRVLEPEEIRLHFSSVWKLSEYLSERTTIKSPELWQNLFANLFRIAHDRLVNWFIVAGECSFSATQYPLRRAKILADRRVDKDNWLWFTIHTRNKQEPSKVVAWLMNALGRTSKRIDPNDELQRRLGTLPSASQLAIEENAEFQAIFGRAAFSACIYDPEDPTLADIYFRMGRIPRKHASGPDRGTWSPRRHAIAFASFAMRHGSGKVASEAEGLLTKTFVGAFRDRLRDHKLDKKEHLGEICDSFEVELISSLDVPPEDAAEAADNLRSKFKVRRRRKQVELPTELNDEGKSGEGKSGEGKSDDGKSDDGKSDDGKSDDGDAA